MKAPQSLDTLVEHVQAEFETLSPQFQISAHYLIDHPTQVSILSARKIAARAGVQPATLVRLAQHLGYKGWEDLKSVFTRELQLRPESYAARAQSLVEQPDSPSALWRAATEQQGRNLRALEPANHQAMDRAVTLLARAPRIFVAGFRSSYSAAFSLYYLCGLFRADTHLLHNTGGTIGLALQHLDADDAIVLISYAPYSREIVEVTDTAHAQGCRTLALCDSPLAPMARQADCVLTFPTQSHSFFPSTVAAQSLVEMLAQQLLLRYGEKAISGLTTTETLLRKTRAYL